MTPHIPYQTKNPTDCKPQGQPRPKFLLNKKCPIQFQAYSFDQEFAQRIDLYPPAPKNTPASNTAFGLGDANALLCALSQPKDKGAALGEFTGTFSRVPASWQDFMELPITFASFPGFAGAGPNNVGRDAFTDVVRARIVHDYFVLDPANVISACSPGTPATAGVVDSGGGAVTCVYQEADIPIIRRHWIYLVISGAVQLTLRVPYITPIGGTLVNGIAYFQTLPSRANYQAWIANALANGWNSTVWDGSTDAASTIGQIIPQDSKTADYSGNILERTTMYIQAK